jgi:hypothetical protein
VKMRKLRLGEGYCGLNCVPLTHMLDPQFPMLLNLEIGHLMVIKVK